MGRFAAWGPGSRCLGSGLVDVVVGVVAALGVTRGSFTDMWHP